MYRACLRSFDEFTLVEVLVERTDFDMKIEAGVGIVFPANGDIIALCVVLLFSCDIQYSQRSAFFKGG